MNKRITIESANSENFIKFYKGLLYNPKYQKMSCESKILYSIYRDLVDLSIKHNWINEKGEVYIRLRRNKAMNLLNIKGTEKMTNISKELEKLGLVEIERVGLNKSNRIYICYQEDLEVYYNTEELLETESETEKKPLKASDTNGSSKIEHPEVRKSNFKKFENRTHTKTNFTKTNFTKTNTTTVAEVEKLNLPTFSEPMKSTVAKWEVDRLMKAIEVFKSEEGIYFKFLKKIYDDNNFNVVDYKTYKKNRKQATGKQDSYGNGTSLSDEELDKAIFLNN